MTEPRVMKIYIASPIVNAATCCVHAKVFRDAGFVVTSSWHQVVADSQATFDPEDELLRLKILDDNIGDLELADLVVVILNTGTGRATYAEIGWALAKRKPVLWLADGMTGRMAFDAHSLVTRLDVKHCGELLTHVSNLARKLGFAEYLSFKNGARVSVKAGKFEGLRGTIVESARVPRHGDIHIVRWDAPPAFELVAQPMFESMLDLVRS